jgi:hypothetical protein
MLLKITSILVGNMLFVQEFLHMTEKNNIII